MLYKARFIKPSIKNCIAALACIFSLFPFVTIIDFGTYTQPYALLAGIAFLPFVFNIRIDFLSAIALSSLMFMGVILYLFAIASEPLIGPLKYLVAYLTPLCIVFPSFYLCRHNALFLRKLVLWSGSIWIIVGLIQITINPSFLSFLVGKWASAAGVVVASGRGVISLAPEPTAFGFHMLLMGAIYYLVSLDIMKGVIFSLSALILALSSSSLLVLSLAFLIVITTQFEIKVLAKTLFFSLVITMMLILLVKYVLDLEAMSFFRIYDIILLGFDNPELLLLDSSINTRIGGIYVAIHEIIDRLFFPFGLSLIDWLNEREILIQKYPFLVSLSLSGFPSGYLIQLYQGGVLFVPFLLYMIKKSGSIILFGTIGRCLILSAILVPVFQFSFATPTFWMFWGVFLEKISRSPSIGEY